MNILKQTHEEQRQTSVIQPTYSLKSDWKFHQIVFLSNTFSNTLSIDPFSTIELELSLKNPDTDPLCINLLNTLLMKKGVFKPNVKVNDQESRYKLHCLLCKKLIYFYKIYARSICFKYNRPFTESLIKFDLEASRNIGKYEIFNAEDYYYDINYESDLKKLMIIELFRCLEGRNPVIDYLSIVDTSNVNVNVKKEKEKEKDLALDVDIDKNNESDLSSEESNDNENEAFLNQNSQSNPSIPIQNQGNPYQINERIINYNIKEEEIIESLTFFSDFTLKEKVEILFFFINYSIEFSGRLNVYKEDLLNQHHNQSEVKYLGYNQENDMLYFTPSTRTCSIFRRNIKKSEPELFLSTYNEIEQYMESLSSTITSVQNQEMTKKKKGNLMKSTSKSENLVNLLTKIKENLIFFKEFEEEEKKKEGLFSKKQFLVKNSSLPNKEVVLLNMSEHVTTRRQLNKLTESQPNCAYQLKPVKERKELSFDEIKQIRVEQQKQERERRLLERNKEYSYEEYDDDPDYNESNSKNGRMSLRRKRIRVGFGGGLSQDENEEEDEMEGSHVKRVGKEKEKVGRQTREVKTRSGQVLQSKDNNNNQSLQYNSNVNSHSQQYEEEQPDPSSEILMDCNLIYRYQLNQIELEGSWGIASSQTTERLSYLFTKSNERHRVLLSKKHMITKHDDFTQTVSETSKINPIVKKDYIFYTSKDLENLTPMDICSANLHEVLLINNNFITNEVLSFLSNEYIGYFLYFSKTIEDKFSLKLSLDNSLVVINGEGENVLGHFLLKGYMNLYRDKEEILRNNSLDENFIVLGKVKLTKQYVVFNPNENYRVMKSYTHRKKVQKDGEDENFDVDLNEEGEGESNEEYYS